MKEVWEAKADNRVEFHAGFGEVQCQTVLAAGKILYRAKICKAHQFLSHLVAICVSD